MGAGVRCSFLYSPADSSPSPSTVWSATVMARSFTGYRSCSNFFKAMTFYRANKENQWNGFKNQFGFVEFKDGPSKKPVR
jgi:hypothetical protein